MIKYFTFRTLKIAGNLYSPQEVFLPSHNTFQGLDITWKEVCSNLKVDGRHLAYFEYDDSLITEDIIFEALIPYSAHAKTYESALDFAKYVTGNDTLTMVNGKIKFPETDITL